MFIKKIPQARKWIENFGESTNLCVFKVINLSEMLEEFSPVNTKVVTFFVIPKRGFNVLL